MPWDSLEEALEEAPGLLYIEEGRPVSSLAQANWLADVYDSLLEDHDEPTAAQIAKSQFKEKYNWDGEQWVAVGSNSDKRGVFVNTLEEYTVEVENGVARRIPLMRPGTFNGVEYTGEDLQLIADNFSVLKEQWGFRPALLPYHQYDHQGNTASIDPSDVSGYFTDVYYDSGVLYGDSEVDAKTIEALEEGKYRYTSTEIAWEYEVDDQHVGPSLVGCAWVAHPAVKGLPMRAVINSEEIAQNGFKTTEQAPMGQSLLPPTCFLDVEDENKPSTWHLPYRDADTSSQKTDQWGTVRRYSKPGPVSESRVRAIVAALEGKRDSRWRSSDLNSSQLRLLEEAAQACEIDVDSSIYLEEGGMNVLTQIRKLLDTLSSGEQPDPEEVDQLREVVDEGRISEDEVFDDTMGEDEDDTESNLPDNHSEVPEPQMKQFREELAERDKKIEALQAERRQETNERTVDALVQNRHLPPHSKQRAYVLLDHLTSDGAGKVSVLQEGSEGETKKVEVSAGELLVNFIKDLGFSDTVPETLQGTSWDGSLEADENEEAKERGQQMAKQALGQRTQE